MKIWQIFVIFSIAAKIGSHSWRWCAAKSSVFVKMIRSTRMFWGNYFIYIMKNTHYFVDETQFSQSSFENVEANIHDETRMHRFLTSWSNLINVPQSAGWESNLYRRKNFSECKVLELRYKPEQIFFFNYAHEKHNFLSSRTKNNWHD